MGLAWAWGSEQCSSVWAGRAAGVNAAASILSLITLGWTGELLPPTAFVLRNPECLLHLGGLALTGTLGQLFIYYTISNFGPVRKTFARACLLHLLLRFSRTDKVCGLCSSAQVIFSMVMASRQLFSLVINSILFGHKLQLSSLPFAAMVFGAMVSAPTPSSALLPSAEPDSLRLTTVVGWLTTVVGCVAQAYKIRKQVKAHGLTLQKKKAD